MLKKLKWRFVIINMAIVAAMLLVIFSLVYGFTANDLQNRSDSALQTLLQQSGRIDRDNMAYPYFVIKLDTFGNYSVSGNAFFQLDDPAFIREILQEVYSRNRFSGTIAKYDLKYQVANGMGIQLMAFIDISGQSASLRSLVQASILIGLFSIGAFLGVSVLLANWSIRPVDRAWTQQRQFISDASHELKTPLTVITTNAELLQSPELTEENRTQFADNILTMSRQMRFLVEALLELGRVDNGKIRGSFQPLDLSALTEECLLPFEPVLYDKGMTLSCEIQPGITVNGSDNYLRQMIETLLDNAGKYGSPGIVRVSLTRQGHGHCLLWVSNPGAPIAEEQLEKIFDRFYRADAARTRDGGFGLGLSIAKSVAEEHGGKIWAESNPTGNCFYISLPTRN